MVVREGRGSVSLLQRALGIGYGRAARLIDFMAEDGIVGPYNGSQAREILLTLEQWQEMSGQARGRSAGRPRAAAQQQDPRWHRPDDQRRAGPAAAESAAARCRARHAERRRRGRRKTARSTRKTTGTKRTRTRKTRNRRRAGRRRWTDDRTRMSRTTRTTKKTAKRTRNGRRVAKRRTPQMPQQTGRRRRSPARGCRAMTADRSESALPKHQTSICRPRGRAAWILRGLLCGDHTRR